MTWRLPSRRRAARRKRPTPPPPPTAPADRAVTLLRRIGLAAALPQRRLVVAVDVAVDRLAGASPAGLLLLRAAEQNLLGLLRRILVCDLTCGACRRHQRSTRRTASAPANWGFHHRFCFLDSNLAHLLVETCRSLPNLLLWGCCIITATKRQGG